MEGGLTPRPTSELLEEQRPRLKELRAALGSSLPSETGDGVTVDDLFLLRFLLSNKKSVDAAKEKVMATLKWRRDNESMLKMLAAGGRHPLEGEMSQFLFSGVTGSLGGGEPVSVVRMGMSDFRKLMSTHGVDAVADYLLYEKERTFRMCDKETRERGRIVKSITIIDFAGFTMFGGKFDNRFFSALGASSKMSSNYFPQLQAKTVAINTPSYYSMVHKTLGAVMPKSSMEKMVMCPAKKTEKQSASSCPFMSQYLGLEAVPSFLGGTGSLPRELQPPGEREGEVPFEALTIKARSYAVLELPVEHRDTMVEFEVMVDNRTVYMTAELQPYRGAELAALERQLTKATTVAKSPTRAPTSSSLDPDSGEDSTEPAPEDRLKIEHRKRDRPKRKLPWKPRVARRASDGTMRALASPGDTSKPRTSLNPQMSPLKLNSRDGLVKGTWRIPYVGRLLITFDNSFSRVRGKDVTFRIVSVPPPEDEEEQSWWESNWGEFASQAKWPTTADDDWSCTIS